MATITELEVGRIVGAPLDAQRGRGPPDGSSQVRGRHEPSRHGVDGRRPQSLRARTHRQRERRRRARAPRRHRRILRRGARGRVAGLASLCVAPDRGHEAAEPSAARRGRSALRRRRRRGRDRGEPWRGTRRSGARPGRLRPAADRDRRREGARRRRPARARRVRHQPLLHVEPRGGRGRRGVREGGRHRQGALPPTTADPERDRAARRASSSRSGDGRADDVVVDAGPAHRARDALVVTGVPEQSCAWSRRRSAAGSDRS